MGGLKIQHQVVDENLLVSLAGELDEDAGKVFGSVDPSRIKKHVVINCQQLSTINSVGARHLVTWIQAVEHYTTFEYEACPLILAEMMSLLPGSLRVKNVTSLEVPYACEECHKEEQPTFKVSDLPESLDLGPLVCPACQGTMKPSLDTKDYLGFLKA